MIARPAEDLSGALEHLPPSGYRALAAVPGFRRIALTGLVSKLPSSMTGLALLLLVSRQHSYAVAGAAVSCAAVGQGLTAPARGRLVDRYARRPVLLSCLGAYLLALGLLVVTARAPGAPVPGLPGSPGLPEVPVLLVLAALSGATTPPVAVMMRAVWHRAAGPAAMGPAMALDSAATGASLVVGPALAGWLGVSVSPLAPFLVVAVLSAGSVWLLTGLPTAPRRAPGRGPRSGMPSGMPSGPLRRLLAADILFVCAVTGMDVVLPRYAQEHGVASYAGWCLGALSLGSVLGSLALGAVPALAKARWHGAAPLLCVFAAGAAVLACAAALSPTAVLLVCPVAGFAVGSVFAALRAAGGDLAPEGRVTETMSWLNTGDLAGGAAGAALFAQVAVADGAGTALAFVPPVVLTAAVVTTTAAASVGSGSSERARSATPGPPPPPASG
ncbi:MFS transporter [Streptomyces sp. p1417]|uniref:MFS transporter n=1 Tax=Streptomyces typhae TaxID=2681492 RepID=A0A6L6X777_9ACTN|nr:MFS transporter [Streptomyces typhae]MVO89420.1 MFS transporter [Streptomyces typhae]